jgi:protein-disulfide isomerase
MFIVALLYSLYSVVLALISMVYIHSYCIMCIASYAVNLMLLFYTWLVRQRFENISMVRGIRRDIRWVHTHKKASALFMCAGVASALFLILFTPRYWEISTLPLNQNLTSGITEEGHPWIGASNPHLTITEFSDYQCFQCKKMHFYLRELMAGHPGKIKLIHRNFPMDHTVNPMVKEPYHVGSGKMALLSLYAAEKGKFWQINDMLYRIDKQKGHFNIREMAAAAGFDVTEFAASARDLSLREKLRTDIRDGIRLGVTGTPGYLIDGKVYVGHIPASILDPVRE